MRVLDYTEVGVGLLQEMLLGHLLFVLPFLIFTSLPHTNSRYSFLEDQHLPRDTSSDSRTITRRHGSKTSLHQLQVPPHPSWSPRH
jgi:hypothetical protein